MIHEQFDSEVEMVLDHKDNWFVSWRNCEGTQTLRQTWKMTRPYALWQFKDKVRE